MKIDTKVIQKAILVNCLLAIYFCNSSISSFLGIVLGAALFLIAKPYGFLGEKEGNLFNVEYIHKQYNHFIKNSLGKQICSLLVFYILTKICWFIPTWFVLVIIGQTYAFWDIIKKYQVFSIMQRYVQLGKQSIQKALALIPKYQKSN